MVDDSLASALDTCTGVAREPVCRPELLGAMACRRRTWTLERNLAIVAELEHCDNLAAFARRHDIRTSLIHTWRRELRYSRAARQASDGVSEREAMFVTVVADRPQPMSHDGAIEVEFGGAVVRM